jgi:predicted O-linked N-acetylglucosamine transferase (SPINDLY family)
MRSLSCLILNANIHFQAYIHAYIHTYIHTQDITTMPLLSKIPRRHTRVLSVAYLTSEWGDNSVGREMHAVIHHHARSGSRIRAKCLDINPAPKISRETGTSKPSWRERIASVCEGGLVDLSAMDDITAAREVNRMRLHILVDLNGWMPGSRAGILALRPAAVQVRCWEYCCYM